MHVMKGKLLVPNWKRTPICR